MAESKKGFNRRDFLKIVGAGTGMAAAGCSKELPEKLIPYVVQPDEVIPGVSTWYAASCGECSSNCGILVRTREGRAVKVEGNPAHPVNKGGLCAIGQSSLQGLYDPDRVREPLRRDVNGAFKPVSWKEALDAVAEGIAAASKTGKETALLTKPISGSAISLFEEFAGKVPGFTHTAAYGNDEVIQQAAAEHTFGAGSRIAYDFSLPKVIVNFGAGFLETWLSPVEYTKAFAANRVPDRDGNVSRFVHFEPRLSLTAANADKWIMNAPGTEHRLLSALLALLVEKRGSGGEAAQAARGISVDAELEGTGVSRADLEAVAADLLGAQTSLVLAGGAAINGGHALRSAVLANLINAVLNNIGTSVLVSRLENGAPRASHDSLRQLVGRMTAENKPVGVLFISGVNPLYSLPTKAGFASGLANVGMVVSMTTHLDETSRLANIVLPLSTNFEAWSDSSPEAGVYNLNQPAMQPLYQSQSLEDTLIALAAHERINQPFDELRSFEDYMKVQWQERTGGGNFSERWTKYVQSGGDWSERRLPRNSVAVRGGAANLPRVETNGDGKGLRLLAFPTVRFGEAGHSANRPWMQEIPDPMSTIVWGSWIEIHPQTAEELGLKNGWVAQIRTDNGRFDAPLMLNPNLHPQVIAVPLGQGHEALGRYAAGVGVNPLSIAPLAPNSVGSLQLFGPIDVRGSVAREELVKAQGHDYQAGRGIVRTVSAAELSSAAKKGAHGPTVHHTSGENGHGAHGHDGSHHNGNGHGDHGSVEGFHAQHHDPLALGPQHKPQQMYEQMDHVLYRWGMSIDVAKCTGCSACVVACYAENNVPVVGKELCAEGREMSWIRIERYLDGPATRPVKAFQPMLCQHCNNAPCEPVCPVYATYHSDEGLNTMVYNRCVGTRYCSNNCSYKVRRFNWFDYEWPEPLNWQLNPDVTVRGVGVMEKCTFCIQRVREAQNVAKDLGRPVQDGEVSPACASSCPADAIKFGNLNDKNSRVSEDHRDRRSYKVLDGHLNTQPAIAYLAKVVDDGEASEAETETHAS